MRNNHFLLHAWRAIRLTLYRSRLTNDTIRSRQHVRWNGQADLLGGFEVDEQFEFRRLLDGDVGGLCALENLVDHPCGASVGFDRVGCVRHQATAVSKIPPSTYRRQPIIFR